MKKIVLLVILLVVSVLISVESGFSKIWRENTNDYPSLAWEEMPFLGNQKDMSLYSDKELFLVSDKNWKDVLPFVSAAVWTQQEGDDVGCSRGYGTPDDVCVYPMLIWHEEKAMTSLEVSEDDFEFSLNSDFSYTLTLSSSILNIGDNLTVYVAVQYNGVESGQQTGLSLRKQHPILNLVSGSDIWAGSFTPRETRSYEFNFTFLGTESSFDIDSSIYFMQQYSPDRITIIGQTPQDLDNLLIAEPELGAGLSVEQIQRIDAEDYLDYWSFYEDVVYVEDDYELALLASTYASLINAPLIIEGSEFSELDLIGKNIVCVGNPVGITCKGQYTLEQLQQKYVDETNTNKIILVNPNDLDIHVAEEFQPEKSTDTIYEIYGGTSLAAPILAGAKHEVIIDKKSNAVDLSINCNNFNDLMSKIDLFDRFVEEKVDLLDNPEYLTIFSSPQSIPQAFNEQCSGSWHDFKNSVDNVYASSSNYVLEPKHFDMKIDGEGFAHIFWEVGLNHKAQILYQKQNLLTKEFSEAINVAEGFLYAYDPKLDIDSEGNIHLIFRGQKIGQESFKLYYKKFDSNWELLEEVEFYDGKDVPYILMIDAMEDGRVNIFFFIYKHDPEYHAEMYYAQLKNNHILFVNKISGIGDFSPEDVDIISEGELTKVFYLAQIDRDLSTERKVLKRLIFNGENLIEENILFDNEDFLLEAFEITLDSQNSLLGLLMGVNNLGPHLSYFVYEADSLGEEINMGAGEIPVIYDEDFRLFVDEENFLHLVGQKIDDWKGIYYFKIDKGGNIIGDTELTTNKEIIDSFGVSDFIFDVYETNNLQKPYVLFDISDGLVDETYTSFYGFNKLPLQYSIRDDFGWTSAENIGGILIQKDYNMKVGRIYGISSSDTSSYLAKVLFDGEIEKGVGGLSIGHDNYGVPAFSAKRTTYKMQGLDFNWECFNDANDGVCNSLFDENGETILNPLYFSLKYFINFEDHGSPTGWWKVMYSDDIPSLNRAFLLGDACSTNDFESGKGDTFGVRVLRRGGIGYIGATGISWAMSKYDGEFYSDTDGRLGDLATDYLSKETLTAGELYQKLEKDFDTFKIDYLLYGDPTIEVSLE